MRRLLGLCLLLSLWMLVACSGSDSPGPGVDAGDAGIDATSDSGSDSAVDSGGDAASGNDSGTHDDAMVAECDEHGDCDDGIACTLDRCVNNTCTSTAPDADNDQHADMSCTDANGDPLGDDCDDAEVTVHVGAAELCDSVDNDCDAFVDELVASVGWYPDLDNDQFGDADAAPIVACAPVSGHSRVATDCDDNNAAVYPGNTEICDALDNDCNSNVDEGLVCDVCSVDNGGCDALTTCTNVVNGRTCGACPSGYVGDGVAGCEPTLTGLLLSSGTLTPAFSSAVTSYSASVLLGVQSVTLTPSAPSGATITVNGQTTLADTPWQSPTLALGDNLIRVVVEETDRPNITYDVIVTRGAQVAYAKTNETAAADNLGTSVAVSGDTLVVGAPGQSDGGSRSGAAYVFVRSGNVWAQEARLTASDADASDEFGASVAIDGDTVIVGAPFESSDANGVNGDASDNSAAASGAAYVFVRAGSTWTQQAYLKASHSEAQDKFGFSVAVDGDTVVVGAYEEDSSASGIDGDATDNTALESGAAYVFTRADSVWTQHAYLKAAAATAGDGFGYSVAIDVDSVIVGAPNRGSGRGAAYVFLRSADVWMQERYLSPMTLDPGDRLGSSVAVAGDTFVVGAPFEDSNASGVAGDELDNSLLDSGSVQVFQRGGMNWMRRYVKASNPGAGDHFGWSVAIDGNNMVVGAPNEASAGIGLLGDQENNDAADSGAAYTFVRAAGAWSQQAYLKASNAEAGDLFGWSAALDNANVVIGARDEDSAATGVNNSGADNTASNSGAVYVFR